jgi:hypothetical protein
MDKVAEPYLNYITNRCHGTPEDYLKLLKEIVEYCRDGCTTVPVSSSQRRIQGLLDKLSATLTCMEHFADTETGIKRRREYVEDTVLYVIGTWTLLLSSFVHLPLAGGIRKVSLAYTLRQHGGGSGCQPYDEDLAGLVLGSGLLPAPGQGSRLDKMPFNDGSLQAAVRLCSVFGHSPISPPQSVPSTPRVSDGYMQSPLSMDFLHDLDALESLSINATRLNAYTLNVFGAVEVVWTHNVARHMLLFKRNGQHVIEVFGLPCALDATSLKPEVMGLSHELAYEIKESYGLLFNAWHETRRHSKLVRALGIGRFCWCWSCSARRYRNRAIISYKKFSQHYPSSPTRTKGRHRSEYDPLLIKLMGNQPSDWTPDLFPSLWSRVMVLEEHLQVAKPWSIWVLFRDRRDTLQFWTFL